MLQKLLTKLGHAVQCMQCPRVKFWFYSFTVLSYSVTLTVYCQDKSHESGNVNDDLVRKSYNTDGYEKVESNSMRETDLKGNITPLDLYRLLFHEKRKSHKEAVNAILNLDRYDKQYNMVKLVLGKMFSTTQDAKVVLMEAGYTPGDPFPTDEKLRDVLSMIMENTVFFGDILLHLPDITHDLLRRNKEWDLMARWGISFCNDTKIYETSELKLVNLMAQELGIIEKDPNYANPYKINKKDFQKQIEKLLRDPEEEPVKKDKKKKKREKKRGPRLSSIPHNEL